MTHRLSIVVIALLAGATGCKRSSSASEATKAPPPSPFQLSVHAAAFLSEVAPNETYREQGLGKKAGPGKTFLCVQYEVKNTSAEPHNIGVLELVIGSESHMPHLDATSNYSPEWIKGKDEAKGGFGLDSNELAPGKMARRGSCYEVAQGTSETGAKVKMTGGDGSSVEANLPAASR